MLLTLPDVAWPADGGKRLRAGATLRALAAIGDLDVAVLAPCPAGGGTPLPPEVTVRRWTDIDPPRRHRLGALLSMIARRVPWAIAVRRWTPARRHLRVWGDQFYDLAWFGSIDHAVSVRRAIAARHVVVDTDDVETAKLAAFLALPRSASSSGLDRIQRRIELPLWRRAQRLAGRHADRMVVCSRLDQVRLGERGVDVVPNTYPDPGPVSRGGRVTERPAILVLIANYHYEPNVDAAVYAATEILPRLRSLVPTARLRLVGRGAHEHLGRLVTEPGVDVVGVVPDVGPELSGAGIAIAPIRYGGGTRLKILEAFAYGVPVVCTRLACEGLDVTDGVHLCVADDPDTLAATCAQLLADPERAAALVTSARRLYEHEYRPELAAAAVRRIVLDVLG
jgi:glycosyltransferase involved in cell wall biosynthesis